MTLIETYTIHSEYVTLHMLSNILAIYPPRSLHPLTYTCIHPPILASTHSFMHAPTHPSIHPLIHTSIVYPSTHQVKVKVKTHLFARNYIQDNEKTNMYIYLIYIYTNYNCNRLETSIKTHCISLSWRPPL